MNTQQNETILNLLPADLLADDNTRFSLKASRVEALAANIQERGQVLVPLMIEPLDVPVLGAQYRILAGHYRHAAVGKLNKIGAGLTLPCIVVNTDDALDRFKTQLAENMERENMTPMDTASAIKKLMDMGMSRIEVRTMFGRPGGRKGQKTQPASNSFINMMLSFLEFPKSVQKQIHEGDIGVSGAYQLSRILKAKPDKFNEVLAQLEADAAAEAEKEEKDEEAYLKSIKKEEEEREKQEKLALEAKEAAEKNAKLLEEYGEVTKAEANAYTAAKTAATGTKEEKEKAEAEFKAAQEKSKAALKAAEDAKKEAEKLAKKLEAAKENADARKKKLEEARKNANSKKAVSGDKVQKSAEKVGANTNYVPLKLADIREFIHTGALPGTAPKVQAIFKAIEDCINGITIPKEAFKIITKVTGEAPEKKAKTPAQ